MAITENPGQNILDMVVFGGYTVTDMFIVGALGVVGFGLYVFLTDKEKQKALNGALGKLVDGIGAGKDKLVDEAEMREKLESAVENQKSNPTEREVEITVDQVMQELEAIQSQSKHIGKEEEQMKGEDSDDLYNISVITMLGVVALVLMQIYVNFM